MPTNGLMSQRGYAQHRGCSPTTVRGHVAFGMLAPAISPDGRIDPQIADLLWRAGVTRSGPRRPRRRVSATLAESKRIRMVTLLRIGERKLQALRESVVEVRAVPIFSARLRALFAEYLDDLPEMLGPEAAGMASCELTGNQVGMTHRYPVRDFVLDVVERRTRGIREMLNRMELPHLPSPPPEQFDNMTAVELATVKTHFASERASLLDRLDKGELLDYAKAKFAWHDWSLRSIDKANYFGWAIDKHLTAATPEQAAKIIRGTDRRRVFLSCHVADTHWR